MAENCKLQPQILFTNLNHHKILTWDEGQRFQMCLKK